jgi:SSS family solute:Na+ symporter
MGVLLLALYGAAVLGLGYACRPRGEAGLFFVNNRASGAWLVGFSLVASCVGASAAMGAAGLAFAVGTPAFWWLGSGAAGLSLLALVLARKVRRSRARTLPEIVEAFFGPRVRRIISCVIVAAWLSILAAQLTALARILVAMTGLSPGGALIAGGLFLAAHTMLGGQAGIIRLDRWQVVLMAAGFFAILFRLGGENPAVFPSLALEAVNADFPPSRLIHFLVILGGGYVVCPMLFGRLLSARDEEAARRGALGAAVGLALASVLIVAVGLLARGLIPPETAEDAVLIAAIRPPFPTGRPWPSIWSWRASSSPRPTPA